MKIMRSDKGFTVVEVAIAVVVVALVSLVGWRVYDANFRQDNQVNRSAGQLEEITLPDDLSGIASIDQIAQSLVAENPDTHLTNVELKKRELGLLYEITLSNGTVYLIDAATGQRINTSTEDESDHLEDDDHALPPAFDGGIGFVRARNLALAKKPEGKIIKIQLEVEEGVVVYSVRFSDKARVDVNAKDGSIVRVKPAKNTEANDHGHERAEESRSGASGGSDGSSDSSPSGSEGIDDSESDHDHDHSHDDSTDDSPDSGDSDNSGSSDDFDDDRSGSNSDSSN